MSHKGSGLEAAVITRALVVKRHWLDLILGGQKTWEIRGSDTKVRGPVALIESGSGMVSGVTSIFYTVALSDEQLRNSIAQHAIPADRLDAGIGYKRPHAWVMWRTHRLPKLIPYRHPQGAVIWVTLGRGNMGDGYDELQGAARAFFGGAA